VQSLASRFLDLIENLADTSHAGRHSLMLMIQHMLKLNPDQTFAEAMTNAIARLQENEKRNFETPHLRSPTSLK
jgi:hypothetical protein